jgi:hypothetical protein
LESYVSLCVNGRELSDRFRVTKRISQGEPLIKTPVAVTPIMTHYAIWMVQ